MPTTAGRWPAAACTAHRKQTPAAHLLRAMASAILDLSRDLDEDVSFGGSHPDWAMFKTKCALGLKRAAQCSFTIQVTKSGLHALSLLLSINAKLGSEGEKAAGDELQRAACSDESCRWRIVPRLSACLIEQNIRIAGPCEEWRNRECAAASVRVRLAFAFNGLCPTHRLTVAKKNQY